MVTRHFAAGKYSPYTLPATRVCLASLDRTGLASDVLIG